VSLTLFCDTVGVGASTKSNGVLAVFSAHQVDRNQLEVDALALAALELLAVDAADEDRKSVV